MNRIIIRRMGQCNVSDSLNAMQTFTAQRTQHTPDEIWLVEHPPVFTLGRRNITKHLLDPADIPVVHVDRGGHVTYHGPGQVVAYLLIDLKRKKIGIKRLVTLIEDSIIDLLDQYNITASSRNDAHGVYVSAMKIASLGLRVTRGCSYHGLSLNVAMDLEPFERINPCGHPGLKVTQVSDQGGPDDCRTVAQDLITCLTQHLGYAIMLDPGKVDSTVTMVRQGPVRNEHTDHYGASR